MIFNFYIISITWGDIFTSFPLLGESKNEEILMLLHDCLHPGGVVGALEKESQVEQQ